MTGQELYEHVRQLARDHVVRVYICATCERNWGLAEEASPNDGFMPVIWLGQMPDTPVPYFTALHELGHHADPARWKGLRLDSEAFAWRWAIEHALIPPTPEVWADIHAALSSYGYDRRYRRTDNFVSLLAEAERNACV